VRPLLLSLANLLGVGWWLRRRNRDRLLILMYHGVVEEGLEPFCWHQLPVRAFRRQMRWVRRHYTVLPLEHALELLSEGRLPPGACAITFDDGYANVASVAAPVLEEERLPATVFLVTDLVGSGRVPWPDRLHLAIAHSRARHLDLEALGLGTVALDSPAAKTRAIEAALDVLKAKPAVEKDALLDALVVQLDAEDPPEPGPFRLMTWDDVERLREKALITFAPHSRTHEILSRVGGAEVERQILGSHEILAERIGEAARVFAYPNGRAQDFDDRAKHVLEAADIPWALSTIEGLARADADMLALPRISVGADLSFARFKLLCSGLV
jgi:peptidoglycan/xylan/chitin deacetylase (PgdA/CDA1 family)